MPSTLMEGRESSRTWSLTASPSPSALARLLHSTTSPQTHSSRHPSSPTPHESCAPNDDARRGTPRRFLLNLLPPGAERLYSLVPGGDVYQLFDAFAAAVKQFGFDLLDVLRLEITPAECIQKLADWESALALVSTRAALHGTPEQRRASVLSRLREAGGFTRPLVQSVIAPLLGFLNSATLQILNTDRVAMRAAHTYTGNGAGQTAPGTFTARVIDDGPVTKAGAQLSITLTAPALEQIKLQLSTRNGKTKTWSGLGTGAIANQTFQLASPELAGAQCSGVWALSVAGTGTLVNWSLFAEGIGIGGLAGDLFEWGVYLDPAHAGETGFAPDLHAVSLTMARIQHAHADGHIVRAFSAAPNTALAIPNQFLPA
jgi:hypothetical protein